MPSASITSVAEHARPVPRMRRPGSREQTAAAQGPERRRPEHRLQPEPEERRRHAQRLVVEGAGEEPEEEVEGEHLGPEHEGPHRPGDRGEEEQDVQRDATRARPGMAMRQKTPAAAASKAAGQHQQRKEASLGERVAPGGERGAEHGERGRAPRPPPRARGSRPPMAPAAAADRPGRAGRRGTLGRGTRCAAPPRTAAPVQPPSSVQRDGDGESQLEARGARTGEQRPRGPSPRAATTVGRDPASGSSEQVPGRAHDGRHRMSVYSASPQ